MVHLFSLYTKRRKNRSKPQFPPPISSPLPLSHSATRVKPSTDVVFSTHRSSFSFRPSLNHPEAVGDHVTARVTHSYNPYPAFNSWLRPRLERSRKSVETRKDPMSSHSGCESLAFSWSSYSGSSSKNTSISALLLEFGYLSNRTGSLLQYELPCNTTEPQRTAENEAVPPEQQALLPDAAESFSGGVLDDRSTFRGFSDTRFDRIVKLQSEGNASALPGQRVPQTMTHLTRTTNAQANASISRQQHSIMDFEKRKCRATKSIISAHCRQEIMSNKRNYTTSNLRKTTVPRYFNDLHKRRPPLVNPAPLNQRRITRRNDTKPTVTPSDTFDVPQLLSAAETLNTVTPQDLVALTNYLNPTFVSRLQLTFSDKLFTSWWDILAGLPYGNNGEHPPCSVAYVIGLDIALRLLHWTPPKDIDTQWCHPLGVLGFSWLCEPISHLGRATAQGQLHSASGRCDTTSGSFTSSNATSCTPDAAPYGTFLSSPPYSHALEVLYQTTVYPSLLYTLLKQVAILSMMRKESLVLLLYRQSVLMVVHVLYFFAPDSSMARDNSKTSSVHSMPQSKTAGDPATTLATQPRHRPPCSLLFSFQKEPRYRLHSNYHEKPSHSRCFKRLTTCLNFRRTVSSATLLEESGPPERDTDARVPIGFSVFEPVSTSASNCQDSASSPVWSFFSYLDDCDNYISQNLDMSAYDRAYVVPYNVTVVAKKTQQQRLPKSSGSKPLSSKFRGLAQTIDPVTSEKEDGAAPLRRQQFPRASPCIAKKSFSKKLHKTNTIPSLFGLRTIFCNQGEVWLPFGASGPAFHFNWVCQNFMNAPTQHPPSPQKTKLDAFSSTRDSPCCPSLIQQSKINAQLVLRCCDHYLNTTAGAPVSSLSFRLMCSPDPHTNHSSSSALNCINFLFSHPFPFLTLSTE